MEAYEGREPYIFISYARVDADKVTPLLEALSSAGYRIWWDKGIEAGADWLKKLFAKVEGCAVFCPLFSEAFQDSRYCFIETAWAYHNEKNIVPLYLEELKEDSFRGLYQLLRKLQYLPLYQYANAAEFVERLGREQAFTPCKAPEWHKTGQIQWRFSETDGVLTIAKNEDVPYGYFFGSISPYQYDPVYHCSTAPWAPYREKIFSIVIADDIRAIGDHAFRGCSSLTDVRISDSVTRIGDFAFDDCANLTTVSIGNGVTKIGTGTFWSCASLTTVCIPDGVTKISASTFNGCASLTTVRIPNGVTQIGDFAFAVCERLTDIRIPDSIRAIGDYAFSRCHSLTNVRIPGNITQISDGIFMGCQNLTDVHIFYGVIRIGKCAFADCDHLTEVRIPDSVTKISEDAFKGCENLKSVKIPGWTIVEEGAFPEHTRVIRRAAPEQSQ